MVTLNRGIAYYLVKSLDWILLALLFGGIKLFNKFVHPFKRQFSLEDASIAYDHTPDTVNNLWLWMLSLVLPILVIGLVWIKRRDQRETYFALLGLLMSSMLAYFICHFVKNLVGRLRPDFLSRCNPDLTKASSHLGRIRLNKISICQATTDEEKKTLRAGSQSFFSGHTSTAFSGLGFLSLYLAYVFCLWRRPGQVYKVIIALAPLMIALYIGLSRISDYRHHWEDVFVGMIMGLLCAVFSFKQYFPIKKPSKPQPRTFQLDEV